MEEERVERYLENKMDPEERKAFEEKMATDKELSRSVLLQEAIMKGFVDRRISDYKERLHEIEREEGSGKSYAIRFYKPIFWIAASFIMILAVQQFFFSGFELYDHYTPYPNYIYPSERGEENPVRIQDAFRLYESEDYESALAMFSEVASNDTIDFYKAQCNIAMKDIGAATPYLEALVKNKEGSFYEQSLWYLSLIYMEADKKDKAEKMLREIVLRNGFQSENARKLLK